MNNKLNIGILGCADIADRMMAPAIIDLEGWTLHSVASRTVEKATRFAEKFNCRALNSYEELIAAKDIQAIYIPLPTGLHYEWAYRAMSAGKHVLCEKSITESFEKTQLLVEHARKNKVVLFENFMFQYHRQIAFVKTLVESNEIGELRTFRSNFSIPKLQDDNFRYNKELGGGALLDVGAYTLMGAQIFMKNVKVLFADLVIDPHSGVDFSGSVILRGDKGVQGQTFFGFDHFYQNTIELCGTKGKITLERAYTAGPAVTPKILLEKQGESHPYTIEPDHHFKSILMDFHDAILSNDTERMFSRILTQASLLKDVMDYIKKY